LKPAADKVRVIVRDSQSGKIGSVDVPVQVFSSPKKP